MSAAHAATVMQAAGQQLVRPAGFKPGADGESTQRCLEFPPREQTPRGVRRFRKSYFEEPGSRVVHYGRIEDEEKRAEEWRQKSAEAQVFGQKSRASEHVPDVFPHGAQTAMTRFLEDRAERVYKSVRAEPLGKPMSHGTALPEHVRHPDFRFGAKSAASEAAKGLVAPLAEAETEEARALYRRSHGAYEPGEQRRRGYKLPPGVDLRETRFGTVDRTRLGEGEGAYRCLHPAEDDAVHLPRVVPKRVEEFKATAPALGRARNLMQEGRRADPDRAFGISTTGEGEWTAADCLGGCYTAAQRAPDADLGRAVRPGWRNAAADQRAFGVPTVRRDVPARPVKSLADHQNYGDDASAAELLFPSRFAAFGVHDDDFLARRAVGELRDIFRAVGYDLGDDTFRRLYWRAATAHAPQLGGAAGAVGVEHFRRALNEYEDATAAGDLPAWWDAAGPDAEVKEEA